MSEDTERTPLATIEAFEATAFRVGQVTRQLLAEHPDLPVWKIRPHVIEYSRHGSTSAELNISTWDTDGVRAWADALAVSVEIHFHDASASGPAFEHHSAKLTISGVGVTIVATREPGADEIEAWRSRKAEEAAAGGAA